MKKMLGSLLVLIALFVLVTSVPIVDTAARNKAALEAEKETDLPLSDALKAFLEARELEPVRYDEYGNLVAFDAQGRRVIVSKSLFVHPESAPKYGF